MYLTILRYRKRKDIDDNALTMENLRIEKLARGQSGFISLKHFTSEDGEVVTISEWASEAAVHAWASHPEHEAIRRRGRNAYFADYALYLSDRPRVHKFGRS